MWLVSLTRRDLAAARRRMRDDPSSVAEVVTSLVIAERIGERPLDDPQIVALGWWWKVNGVVEA